MRSSFRIGKLDPKSPAELAELRQFIADTGVPGFRAYERDHVVVARSGDSAIQGVFCWRPVILLHEFRIKPIPGRRLIAEGMVNYSLGAARERGFTECIMLIDKPNAPMLQFAEGIGAIEDPGYDNSRLFYFDIR